MAGKFFLKLLLFLLLIGGSMQMLFIQARKLEKLYYEDSAYAWVNHLALRPKVLIMGSSTAEDDLSAVELSRVLGLRRGEVIDVGWITYGPLQMLHCWNMIRNSRDSVKVVLMGIDPWIAYQSYDWIQEFPTLYWSPWQRLYTIFDTCYPHFVLSGKVIRDASKRGIAHMISGSAPKLTPLGEYGSLTLTEHPKNFKENTREYFGETSLFPISDLYMTRMAQLKDSVEASGAVFILFLTPKEIPWLAGYRRDCLDLDSDIVANLNRALGPTRLIGSFSAFESDASDSLFVDHSHLSGRGQKNYTDTIAAHLPEVLASKPKYLKSLLGN